MPAFESCAYSGIDPHPHRARSSALCILEHETRRVAALVGAVPVLPGLGCLASAVVQYRRWRDA